MLFSHFDVLLKPDLSRPSEILRGEKMNEDAESDVLNSGKSEDKQVLHGVS